MRLRRRTHTDLPIAGWMLLDGGNVAVELGGATWVLEREAVAFKLSDQVAPTLERAGAATHWRALTERELAWRRWPWDAGEELGISSYKTIAIGGMS